MKLFLFLCFSLFYSTSVPAVTLGEIGAAVGVANTLQNAGKTNTQNTLENVKSTVQKYEDRQKEIALQAEEALANAKGAVQGYEEELSNQPPSFQIPSQSENQNQETMENQEELSDLSGKGLNTRLQDEEIYQEVNPVDYKASVQVFYKRKCSAEEKNCIRGAVLTNIKSVIFNYAHARGSFVNTAKKKGN